MNRKELYGKGYTYVITRRILPGGSGLRVRVKAYKGLYIKGDTPVENEYRDYKFLYEGDAAFARIVKQYQEHVSK